jgi:hypothetical protein
MVLGIASLAQAYPGGTPTYQTDVAPYCAGCHSSINEQALAGAGDRATKEVAENKHLASIAAGRGAYEELLEADRQQLIEWIRAVDANSSVTVQFPAQVAPGETFTVTVDVTGGAGPVVGVALVDDAHRWYARPLAAAGFGVVGAPTVIGQDGKPQTDWVDRRPESLGREITYVNITGVASDAEKATWGSGKAIFTLKAPVRPGHYPLVAAYFYGTEKASSLGTKVNTVGWKMPRGTTMGGSGRVRFSDVHTITVKEGSAAE